MKKCIAFLCILLWIQEGQAQLNRYIIRFKDKGTNPFSISNPSAYLSSQAIARRTNYNIAIDSTDLPVTPRYVDSIKLAGAVTILNVSKWLNSVTIFTTDANALIKISSFPFVISFQPIAPKEVINKTGKTKNKGIQETEINHLHQPLFKTASTNGFYNYGASARQVIMHKGNFLHDIGLRGQGIKIGMLDAGYNNYLTVSSLDSARTNGQVLGTWDFVDQHASVNENNAHGMECFSVIAANLPGQFVGTAPKASFYLYRSEDASTEYPIEEHNWVCAAERVDSIGGDMISSSVGYNEFDDPSMNHSFSEMDGNTTMCAIGADLAAKKGILVVNSAGNEGLNSWGKIITPADGDSVLAVGAVDSLLVPAVFTSRGPSADGQIKPDVASMGVGTIVQYPNNSIAPNNGTSFAGPNLAGLAACLWQGFKEYNNYKIIQALRNAGHRSSNPNDTVGYGVPDVKLALIQLTKEFSTATATLNNCKTTITGTTRDMKAMKYEVERKTSTQSNFTKVGEFSGIGNIFAIRNYTFSDSLINITAGIISYRIKQFFDTAAATLAFDYIDTVTVNLNTACLVTAINPVTGSMNKIEILPNPARNKVSVKVMTEYPVTDLNFIFTNNAGQMVTYFKRSKTSGLSTFDFPIDNLPAGKYYITVSSGKRILETHELIKY